MNCPEMFVDCAIPTGFNIPGSLFDYKHFTPNGVSAKFEHLNQSLKDVMFILKKLKPQNEFRRKETNITRQQCF